MKRKDKILIQTVACMTILAVVQGTPIIKNDTVIEAKEKIVSQINKEYTSEDIKNLGNKLYEKILDAPRNINTAIMVANEMTYSAYPIDESSTEDIKKVKASFGGEVISAGIDKQLGVCIRIKNGNKIATYGNLKEIYVITGERVIKSKTIGTFDEKSNKEFYYQLADNMV